MHADQTQMTSHGLSGAATLIFLLAVAGCDIGEGRDDVDRTMPPPTDSMTDDSMPAAGSAVARIMPTSLGNAVGTVTFSINGTDQPMQVSVDLRGMAPGAHGIHVHEAGDCSAEDASSAGAHFNPDDTPHGGPDSAERHVGDMGNVEADDDGRVSSQLSFAGLALSGPASVLQKSVVIHRRADDFKSQPAGASGDRVGCGVIQRERQAAVD